MLKRISRRYSTFVILAAALPVSLASAQPPPSSQAPPGAPLLATLVRDAVAHNLAIDSAKLTPEIAAAGIQAARGAFDARLELRPLFGRASQTIVTPGGALVSSLATTTINGGAGGLLPYSAVELTGNLPTGTQYGLSLQSARQSQDPVFTLGGQAYPVQFNSTLSLSISQPLLRGAGSTIARAGIRSAALGADASRARFGRTVEQTVAEVETAYWTAVLARNLETVAEESLKRAVTLLDRNQQMLQLQLLAAIDVLTARQAVAVRQQVLTQARQQRADATDNIVFLVYGRDAAAHLADSLDLEAAALPDAAVEVSGPNQVQIEALGTRLDLVEAQRQLDRSRIGVTLARDSLRPSVTLTASYTAVTNNVSTLRVFGADRVGDFAIAGWQGGVQVTVPVGNNIARAGYTQTTLIQSQQETAIAAVQNTIRQEVRQAVRAIQMNSERVQQTTEALTLALQQYQAEDERLQLGLSDSFRLLQFEQEVAFAQQIQLQARFSLAQAFVAYDLARGASATKYGVSVSTGKSLADAAKN